MSNPKSVRTLRGNRLRAREFRSRRQRHPKRKSQHRVIDCCASRSQLRCCLRLARRTTGDGM